MKRVVAASSLAILVAACGGPVTLLKKDYSETRMKADLSYCEGLLKKDKGAPKTPPGETPKNDDVTKPGPDAGKGQTSMLLIAPRPRTDQVAFVGILVPLVAGVAQGAGSAVIQMRRQRQAFIGGCLQERGYVVYRLKDHEADKLKSLPTQSAKDAYKRELYANNTNFLGGPKPKPEKSADQPVTPPATSAKPK